MVCQSFNLERISSNGPGCIYQIQSGSGEYQVIVWKTQNEKYRVVEKTLTTVRTVETELHSPRKGIEIARDTVEQIAPPNLPSPLDVLPFSYQRLPTAE